MQEECVAWKASQPREPGAERPDGWDLLATHACAFVRVSRPGDVANGQSLECFGNSATAVAADPERFEYVEGIAGGRGGPGGGTDWDFKPHAWATFGDGRAVLLTDRGGYGLLGLDGSADDIAPLLELFSGLR